MPISREYLDIEPQRKVQHEIKEGLAKEDSDLTNTGQFGDYDTTFFGQRRESEQVQTPESRQELIARIKKDQKPIWLQDTGDVVQPAVTTPLQPSPVFSEAEFDRSRVNEERRPNALELASGIERPRSALHAGDFRDEQEQRDTQQSLFDFDHNEQSTWTSTSPTDPWYTPSFSVPRHTPWYSRSKPSASQPLPAQARSRAASQSSLSSSFVLRAPTSPLVWASGASDFDNLDAERIRSRSPEKSSRRHTFSPRSLRTTQYSPTQLSPSFAYGRPYPTPRREEIHPYQRHNSNRSIPALSNLQHHSIPQTPISRSRRASTLSDGSPLQAPLVGGYEESILRGRMSTLPSRPLDFVAQIGVLGQGECKRSLQCPPHISIPFPAVYYNYGNTREGTSSSGGPSPYVGLINMENNSKERDNLSSNGSRLPETSGSGDEMNVEDNGSEILSNNASPTLSLRKTRQKLHNSTASRKAPKGGYRIPQQGQLQIIIKNPNKTAVKLFLIPYNLAGMEPGKKTFIRQRSYSAGPVIDMPLSCRKNFGSDRPEASLSNLSDPNDRPVLRYLIHLHICCPSRGRFYLYRSIRVVFANRVPDGKEKLRNEIQLPEPRYSAFKPDIEPTASRGTNYNERPSILNAAADLDPPSLSNAQTQQDFYFGAGSPRVVSDVPQLPLADQSMSFGRKPLPAVLPEGSSIGSGSSRRSDLMQVDSAEGSTGAFQKSNTSSPRNLEIPFRRPDFGHPITNENNRDNLTIQTRSTERSQSSRDGLLSLQLRDLARNGSPSAQSEM